MKTHINGAIKGKPGIAGFGERLKCVREMRRKTQEELGEKLDMPAAQISHYECGQRLPGADHIRRLCLALNVSADYLLDSHT